MSKSKYTSIGGSALIEGVMMRGNGKMAIAVRKETGEIILKVEKTAPPNKIINKIPIVRGIYSFIMSMVTSYKALMYSAEVSVEDALEQEPESKLDMWLTKVLGKGGMQVLGIVSMVLGMVFAVAAFIYLPTLIADLFSKYVVALSPAVKRLSVGVFKMLLFILYMFAVSRMKDMRRVFMYHGAEHKTIFCYEAGESLCVQNAKTFNRFHPRCGTSFIVIVLLVSFFASLIIPWKTALLHSVIKFLFLPVIMGLAFECIRLAGKYDNVFTRILSAPGVWMQRITTIEPDDDMLEVAVWSMRGVLEDMPTDTRLTVEGDTYVCRDEERA